jgi:predicted nucleic acid-binding protein
VGNKIFFDINIIMDIIEPSRENHDYGVKVLQKCYFEDLKIYMSEDMINTVYYLSTKKDKSIKFFQNAINEWQIVPFGANVLNQAFDFALKNGLDLEDTLQCFCAKENGCDLFLTSDKKFVDCGVKIVTYKDFLESD